MRLDKFLSDSTAYSRKELRTLIRRGGVTIDGTIVRDPGSAVSPSASVLLNGTQVIYQKYLTLMLNKPAGYLSATEDEKDPVVTGLIPEAWRHYHLFPVGRLDKDTEGLLLLTNDGDLDHRLTSPKKMVFKRYFARLDLPAAPEDAAAFAAGMDLGDFVAKPGKIHLTDDPREVYVEIAEGKFHQVKRMWEKRGKNVIFLKRVAIGGLALDPALATGMCRELSPQEIASAETGKLPPVTSPGES